MNTDKKTHAVSICVYLRLSAAILVFLLASCGKYADFTLPPLPGAAPPPIYRFIAQPEPVLARGEYHDALNPSVTVSSRALVPVPVNLYSVFDGRTWHTAESVGDEKRGIILSPDPKTWEGSYIA